MDGVPGQPLAVGVTVMVDVMAEAPVLVAVKEGVLPAPLAARPIALLEFVHAKVAPATLLVYAEAATVALLQTVMFAGTVTVGVGLTVMVYDTGVPGHPVAVGVTVMVAVTGVLPVLVAVNAGVLPLPLAARPMEVLELVHVKVVPATLLVYAEAATAAPLQTVLLAGTVTFGVGLTVIVYVTGVPVQPANVGVTVIVPVIGVVPVLVAANAGVLPLPLAARPIAVFEFVQLNVAPEGVLVKEEAATVPPLQIVMFAGTVTVGVGFTVIV